MNVFNYTIAFLLSFVVMALNLGFELRLVFDLLWQGHFRIKLKSIAHKTVHCIYYLLV